MTCWAYHEIQVLNPSSCTELLLAIDIGLKSEDKEGWKGKDLLRRLLKLLAVLSSVRRLLPWNVTLPNKLDTRETRILMYLRALHARFHGRWNYVYDRRKFSAICVAYVGEVGQVVVECSLSGFDSQRSLSIYTRPMVLLRPCLHATRTGALGMLAMNADCLLS